MSAISKMSKMNSPGAFTNRHFSLLIVAGLAVLFAIAVAGVVASPDRRDG